MKERSYIDFLLSAFFNTWGAIIAGVNILGVLFSLRFFEPQDTISLRLFGIVILVLFCFILLLLRASYEILHSGVLSTPKVSVSREPPASYDFDVLLLLESHINFSNDSLVTIYRIEEGVETLFGIGSVTIIQEDSRIQIAFNVQNKEAYHQVISELHKNSKDEQSKLIVKPTVPRSSFM